MNKSEVWLFLYAGILGGKDMQTSLAAELAAKRTDEAVLCYEERFGKLPEAPKPEVPA